MDVEGAYDAAAEVYAERFWTELRHKPYDCRLLDGLAKRYAGPVADIGCGPGQIGRYVADRDVEVVCVDRSPGMVAEAWRRNPGMRVERADVRALPFADGELGGALAFHCLIHLEPDELVDALRELRRVIAVGGLLCIAVHEGDERVHVDDWLGTGASVDARFIPEAELVAAVRAAGFVVESAEIRDPYPEESTTRRLYVIAVAAPPGSG